MSSYLPLAAPPPPSAIEALTALLGDQDSLSRMDRYRQTLGVTSTQGALALARWWPASHAGECAFSCIVPFPAPWRHSELSCVPGSAAYDSCDDPHDDERDETPPPQTPLPLRRRYPEDDLLPDDALPGLDEGDGPSDDELTCLIERERERRERDRCDAPWPDDTSRSTSL
jgi:hypothetical protein